METGMLWFDNDPKTDLLTKILQAAMYYQQKYGEKPNLCFVHPSMLQSLNGETPPLKIISNIAIIKNHFWIGVQTKHIQLT
jgi:hypothetical protein